MKKLIVKWKVVLVILVAVSLLGTNIAMFVGLINMQKTMKTMNSKINQLNTNVSDEVSGITNSIITALDDQNSLISSYEFVYGNLDAQKGKIEVGVHVVPKECTARTTLRITYQTEGGGVKEVMAKRLVDNHFEANLKLPYDADYHIGVVLSEGAVTRQEYLDWVYNLKDQMQIQVTGAYVNGDVTYGTDSQVVAKGDIHMEYYNPTHSNSGLASNQIAKVQTKVYINQQEVAAYEMETDQTLQGKEAGEQAGYILALHEKYGLNPSDKFEIAVEVDDTAGFHYKTYAFQGILDQNGEFSTQDYSYGYVEITP